MVKKFHVLNLQMGAVLLNSRPAENKKQHLLEHPPWKCQATIEEKKHLLVMIDSLVSW